MEITGTIYDSQGTALGSDVVVFAAIPERTAKVVGANVITAAPIAVTLSSGALPDSFTLKAGSYEVTTPRTKPFIITVGSGDGPTEISTLVTSGASSSTAIAATPASSVVSETSFGQSASVGSATEYARADHTHGTPADPGGSTPASTVVEETDFDQASAVGTATAYARADHTHGTPATPTKTTVGLGNVDNTADADKPVSTAQQTALDARMLLAVQVTSIPASPTRGQVYELTQADATAKAPPGFYVEDGSGWFCIGYSAAYNLGNLTGALSLSLIAGAAYVGTTTGNITTYAVSLSRTGIVTIRRSNASGYTVVQPTSAGRTQKLLSSTAWDAAAGNGVLDVLEDDGTYIIAATSLLA